MVRPSALTADWQEAVHKGRPHNPGLPVTRLHFRSNGDDGVAPRFGPLT